jgi:error-prone DNA polymerase
MPPYVPLWTKSCFSFLEGASHPEEYVETALAHGIEAIALTDRDGVYGAVEMHLAGRERGVKILHGSEITVDDGSTIVLLAANRTGWARLCTLVTAGRRRSEKGTSAVGWREVYEHAEGVIALWGGERSLLAGRADPFFVAHGLKEAFGDRLYAMAARHRRAEEPAVEARVRARAEKWGLPVAAAHEALYHKPARRDLQDVLTAVRHRVKLVEAGRLLKPNDEHALKAPHAFTKLFEDDAAAVTRTVEIASRCAFTLAEIRYRYPSERLPDGQTSAEWLRELTFSGAAERYPEGVPPAVRAQLERELHLIVDLDYGGYFLTMWEIVRFCRERGILCQGRGSAANSAVCFCLGITAVDPVAMGLLFERFLSKERAEPPDIDLDIEHDRREEVIQHVYAKYGRTHAAMVANLIRYRPRSAARDVGKALGIAETALDRLSKILPHYGEVRAEHFAAAGLDPDHAAHAHAIRLANEVLDFPRHLSIHPGGFLLGHDPVPTLVPIENATMPDRTVIQWDKDMVEGLGLFKVDLLGLGALNHLHKAFDLLARHHGRTVTLATIPKDDPATYDMICKADTVGVFQIESRAQMAMLPRLRPRNYYDLVVEVSIVRPGPITGGMVHPYLRRRSGEEAVVYPHPSLEPVLAKTLGVPLFQEQVIRLAMVAADYTPGEADQLRRDMAAWRKTGRIERHRERLVARMEAKGIEREFAERVFDQIRGFGEYGFPESHAASFALIAYATAWLRRHHLDVFTCALLNAQPMGFYSAATILDDAKRHGLEVRPVDVVRSEWECVLEGGQVLKRDISTILEGERNCSRLQELSKCPVSRLDPIRIGLRYVKGLGENNWEKIVAARNAKPFASVEDFVRRTGLDDGAVTRLAEAGAFASLDPSRRGALWSARGAARTPRRGMEMRADERVPRFVDLDPFETIAWDYRASGHSALGHPLEPLRERLRAHRIPDAHTVSHMGDGRRVRYAGLVICRQRPGTASGIVFMTLEDETGFVNVVVWAQVYERFKLLVKTASFLGVTGRLQVQDGVVHLIADVFWEPKVETEAPKVGSRDFH